VGHQRTRERQAQQRMMVAVAERGLDSLRLIRAEPMRGKGAPQHVRSRNGAPPTSTRLSLMHAAGAPPADPAREFVTHLPLIERVIGVIARRHALSSAEADEFGSWSRTRIIDSDYAVFRKFGGRSSMSTYLSAVFGHLLLDYRNSVWGRWRPCAAATRMGPVGIRLDELLHRDGYSLREAREVLRSAGVVETDAEIGRMAAQLPSRSAATEVSLAAIDGTVHEAGRAQPDVGADDDGFQSLREAIDALPAEDQVIMRMRFWDDVSVADIARVLRLEQKPLYRRIEAIEQTLRDQLTVRGVDRDRARDLLSSEVAW
jgi:RNA polymerase sigma factor (sigma-70 family)